jgi:hypothetical protein
MHISAFLLTAFVSVVASSASFAVEGEGLMTAPRWQSRILLGTSSSGSSLGSSGPGSGLNVRSFSVMGDYYFGNRLVSRASTGALNDLLGGSFRATSGLLVGPRSAPYSSVNAGSLRSFNVDLRSTNSPLTEPTTSEPNAVPYLGVGYSGASSKGGWGFSADVGVMALNPGSAVKLGRVLGGQSLDDTLRDMRVSPMLQLGVSYSF